MRASCQFARDHAYLDDRFEQGLDKPLGLRFRKLLVQALMLVMSAQDCAQPCQDRRLVSVVDDVGEEEKIEEVDVGAGGREQVVSQRRDGRSYQRVHLEMNVEHYFVGYVISEGAMKLGAVVLVLVHQEDIG